jgi:hypothetical protein
MENLIIVGLHAENIMRVRAVDIIPPSGVVVVGGNNEQGKTSLLECIAIALGGSKVSPNEPLRKDAKAGIIVADLGDIIITKTLDANQDFKLEVKSKEGARFPSPQKMLEELVGRVSFDPVQFMNMESAKQLATLKKIVGLDFTKLDERYANAYGTRTDVKRSIAQLKARLDQMSPLDDSLPKEPIDAIELSRQIADAESRDERLNDLEMQGREASALVNETSANIQKLEAELMELRETLKRRQDGLEALRKQYDEFRTTVIDVTQLRKDLAGIKATNECINNNALRLHIEGELMLKEDEHDFLEKELGDIAIEKEKMLTAAKFPIKDLSFDDNGLLYKGTPFSQASAAAKLRASIAMGISLNPKIRVMIIRDGSLLDDDNMKLISDMAIEHNAQIWVERVGKGEECTVIIEDGRIIEDRTTPAKKTEPKANTKGTRKPASGPRAKP